MLKVLPVINNKGGVGKTTTAVNLAAGLAREGRRVLLVDLDSQGSASLSLGVDRGGAGSAEALYRMAQLGDTARPTAVPNLFVSPGTLRLAHADVRLASVPNRVGRLRQVLAPVRDDYDVVLLDCAPASSLLNVNALVAADALVVPLTPDYLAVQGLLSFGDLVLNVRKALGQVAPMLGIALTNADPDSAITQGVADSLQQRFGGKLFRTVVRPDPALRAAPAHGQDVFSYAPEGHGAADYGALAREVADRIDRYSAIFQDGDSPSVPAVVTNRRAAAVERVASVPVAA